MNPWRWILIMALGIAGVARADLEGTYKTITLDGSLADWDAGDVLYGDDEIVDGDPENSSYANIYVANNNANLYIGLETKGTGGGDIFNTYTRNIYIDADMDGDTGFDSGWMTGGYDFLVQYGAAGGVFSVFAFSGGDQTAWSWNFIDTIAYSYGDSVIELAIPLAHLGLSGGDQARIEFHVTGDGVNTETWAHQSEASVETYTVAVETIDFAQIVITNVFAFRIANSNTGATYRLEAGAAPEPTNWVFTGYQAVGNGGDLHLYDPSGHATTKVYRVLAEY